MRQTKERHREYMRGYRVKLRLKKEAAAAKLLEEKLNYVGELLIAQYSLDGFQEAKHYPLEKVSVVVKDGGVVMRFSKTARVIPEEWEPFVQEVRKRTIRKIPVRTSGNASARIVRQVSERQIREDFKFHMMQPLDDVLARSYRNHRMLENQSAWRLIHSKDKAVHAEGIKRLEASVAQGKKEIRAEEALDWFIVQEYVDNMTSEDAVLKKAKNTEHVSDFFNYWPEDMAKMKIKDTYKRLKKIEAAEKKDNTYVVKAGGDN